MQRRSGIALLFVACAGIAFLWPKPAPDTLRHEATEQLPPAPTQSQRGPAPTESPLSPRKNPGFAKLTGRLVDTRTDADIAEGARALLHELVTAIREEDPIEADFQLAFEALDAANSRLGAELLATSIGMTRTESGLRALLAHMDAWKVTDASDALQLDRLVNAVICSAMAAPVEACPETRCRYAVQRGSVREPFVREWLYQRLLATVRGEPDDPSANATLWRIALGFGMGEIPIGDAERFVRVVEETQIPTRRSGLILAMGYSRNDIFRAWLRAYMNAESLVSPQETRHVVSAAALAGLDEPGDVETLVRLLAPGTDDETVNAVVKGLQDARPTEVDWSPVGRRLLEIAGSASEWKAETRVRALQAYRLTILSWGADPSGVANVLRDFARMPKREILVPELRICVRYLRPREAEAFVTFLRDGLVSDEEAVQIVRSLRKSSMGLTDAAESTLWRRIASDGGVPQEVRDVVARGR